MPITPTFYNRDFSVKLQLPGGPYLVESYAHAALGGPAHAALSVNGGDEALWQLLDLLRCPVEFTNDAQQIVWNGYVAVVVLRVGALEFSVSLDDLGNKVTVAFGTM